MLDFCQAPGPVQGPGPGPVHGPGQYCFKFSNERTWSDTIIKQATPPHHHHQTFLNSISEGIQCQILK